MSTGVSPENEQYIQTAIENGQCRDRGQALDDILDFIIETPNPFPDIRREQAQEAEV